MQFICPTGFYGAERWILALAKHLDPQQVRCDLAVSSEPTNQDLELTRQYKQQLLQHWETLLFETEKARELATAAKKFVYENYSAQRMASEYTGLFQELTQKN